MALLLILIVIQNVVPSRYRSGTALQVQWIGKNTQYTPGGVLKHRVVIYAPLYIFALVL